MGCRTVNRIEAVNSRTHHQSFQELDHEIAKGQDVNAGDDAEVEGANGTSVSRGNLK
jgi:hypothetical protein